MDFNTIKWIIVIIFIGIIIALVIYAFGLVLCWKSSDGICQYVFFKEAVYNAGGTLFGGSITTS
jgi:uncharacterized membrane protein